MLGNEIDLMKKYPRTVRDVESRGQQKTETDRRIAREFGQAFFDGSRDHGYGGFHYHAKYWQPVVPDFKDRYSLNETSSVLDIGCAKGFMLHDFAELIPGITVKGIDVSNYAIERAIDDMKPHVAVGDARELPFKDKSFDLIISINTIHNLEKDDLARALRE